MLQPPDPVGFLGAWRWTPADNLVFVGEDVATAYGIDPRQAQAGVPINLFSERIHLDDQETFRTSLERAAIFGGPMNFAYRLMIGRQNVQVQITGTCVRAENGRPTEYLGAIHLRDELDESPLLLAADHLIAAGELARQHGDDQLSYFIEMALQVAGSSIAEAEQQNVLRRPRIAASNGRRVQTD